MLFAHHRKPAQCGLTPSKVKRVAKNRFGNVCASLLFALAGAAGVAHAQSCSVGETSAPFAFTGGEQTVTVPAGVQSATVYLSGAQGGNGLSGAGGTGGAGGLGGRVQGSLAVTPGAVLSIWVGGQATQAVNPGGIGQGVDGIGGGATDLRVGGNAVGNRVAVAGGGGGGGNAGWSTANVIAGGGGGAGGGGAGGAGADVPGGPGPFGGGGGTVGVGGVGGGGCGSVPATAGNTVNGNGGDSFNLGGSFPGAGFGGGGGGGATVGAGGGGAGVGTTACLQNWNGGGGGGAGGSSAATGLTATTQSPGVQTGNGAALICFAPPQYSVGGTAAGQTGAVTLELAAANPVSSQQVIVALADTTFVFPTSLPAGADWMATVVSAPAGQLCSLTPASGSAIGANVTNVALSCVTVVVTVNPATLPNGAVDAPYAQNLSATSANGGVAPYTFVLSAGALPTSLTLSSAGVLSGTPSAAGTFNFTAQATSNNGFTGTRAYTVVIDPAPQALTFPAQTPANQTFSAGGTFPISPVATSASPNSGNPIVYSSTTTGVCTVSGTTVTIVSAGTCTIAANQAGNANYAAAAQVTQNVAIGLAAQTLTFTAQTPASQTFSAGGTFAISPVATSASPNSGNPIVYSSTTTAACTVSGTTVTIVTAGTCTVAANQAGNANYAAATQVTQNVAIGLAAQVIVLPPAAQSSQPFVFGATFALSPIATGGGSGNPVVYTAGPSSVCAINGTTITMVGAGTCTITANQAAGGGFSAAAPVTQAIAFAPPEVAVNVPTLSEWLLALLVGLLAVAGSFAARPPQTKRARLD